MPDAIIPAPVVTTQNKYVVDYSTVARTNPALTAVSNTVTLTATASLAGYGWSEVAANLVTNRLNLLQATVNALAVDITGTKQTLAAIIADLQANNLAK